MTIYLDHAATSPVRREAFEAMVPWLTDFYGNASGGHQVAREARKAVDEARDVVASCLGCEPGEVVFTSGGTEADNLAIAGGHRGGPVVCSAIEHHAVLHAVEAVGGSTFGVDGTGTVDADALAAALGPDTTLVSVMLANNEVGTIQDLDAVAAVIGATSPQAVLHSDAVQGAPWLDVARRCRAAGMVSVAAHKFGGPQGVGALVVRRGVALAPQILGGGQERERRSGTHNVAGVVGMAAALAATLADRSAAYARAEQLRDRLVARTRSAIDGVVETATTAARLPNIAHLRIAGVESEALLVLLDDAGVCASAGSSCASGAMEPSHVLAAMGVDRVDARTAVRLSVGRSTTEGDVDAAVDALAAAVARLRR